jgi:hypothetical protein
MLADIKATDFSGLKENGWMPIVTLTIFAISDFIGRMLPRWKRTVILTHVQLWIPILLRAGFIAIFVLWAKREEFAVGDVWLFILVCMFGISHGYCAAIDMMVAPGLVAQNKRERELAGITMVRSLTYF